VAFILAAAPAMGTGGRGPVGLIIAIPGRTGQGSDMTWPVSPIQAHLCQAESTCGRPSRFRARLEAADGRQPVRKSAEACGGHLGDMVQALTMWARGHHLTEGQLTVLVIDPPFSGPCLLAPADPSGPEIAGFAFSTIRLTE
jgi:hypothetical protein